MSVLKMSDKDSEDLQNPEITPTKDGSHTLYSHRFDQHYHNPNGAVAESKYNFFEANGLYETLKTQTELTILEVGFGTGLNLLLTLDALSSFNSKTHVNYYSIEAYPVDAKTASGFNYENHIAEPTLAKKVASVFGNIEEGVNRFSLSPQLDLTLFYGLFENFSIDDIQADYIFHDPFSPDVNKELWTGETFQRLKALGAPSVILTTYSAASKAKGAMAWAGWKVAKTRGALGKREMTVAALDAKKLEGLERVNEAHLAKRYENDDF